MALGCQWAVVVLLFPVLLLALVVVHWAVPRCLMELRAPHAADME